MRILNETARERGSREHIPDNLLVPVVANDVSAIETYVGPIVAELSRRNTRRAFLVQAYQPEHGDKNLKIWDDPNSSNLFDELQVWVHVDYDNYRHAYKKAFPGRDLGAKVLSHAKGRRIARILEYQYVRITEVDKGANSSSVLSELWGYDRWLAYDENGNKDLSRKSKHLLNFLEIKPSILYADTTELLLMLNRRIGGGVMQAAYEAEELFMPRESPPLDGPALCFDDLSPEGRESALRNARKCK